MAHKYVGLPGVAGSGGNPDIPGRTQDVLDTAVAILTTAGQREIPIVATAENDRITVFWWSPTRNAWESCERLHTARDPAPSSIEEFEAARWSDRISIAAHVDRVFLVYRRQPVVAGAALAVADGGIYVDVLPWNDVNERLTIGAPVEIPLTSAFDYDATGYYLWAGIDAPSASVLVLCQTIRRNYRLFPLPQGRAANGIGIGLPVTGTRPRDSAPRAVRREIEFPIPGPGGSWRPPRPEPWRPPRFEIPERPELVDWQSRPGLSFTTVTRLVLLRAAWNADLRAGASWARLEIDDGGYDSDARVESGVLACVYRRDPYSVGLRDIAPSTLPAVVNIPADPDLGCGHEPLRYREIDVAAMALRADRSLDDVHGGERPQLQRLAPLSITFDRVFAGNLAFGADGGVALSIERFGKMLYVRQGTAAALCQLFTYDGRRVPRNLVSRPLQAPAPGEGLNLAVEAELVPKPAARRQARHAFFSTMGAFVPAYFVGGDAEIKQGIWHFLHHAHPDGASGCLAVRRYRLDSGARVAALEGTRVMDIGHAQIGDADDLLIAAAAQPTAGENRQFRPFKPTGAAAGWDVDNTMGGALSVERSTIPPRLFAYTDLGDGGCRVIFASDVSIDTASQAKYVQLGDIAGPGLATDTPVELPLGEWSRYSLPAYPVTRMGAASVYDTNLGEPGSLCSGMHVAFDSALLALQVLGQCGGNTVVDRNCAGQTASALMALDGSALPFSSGNPATALAAVLRISPATIYTGGPIIADPAASGDPDYELTAFSYNIADARDVGGSGIPANGKRLMFTTAGRRTISLTVSNAGGLSVPSREIEVTLSGRPGGVRGLYAVQQGASITLRWLAPDYGSATWYRVVRRDPSGANPVFETGRLTVTRWSEVPPASATGTWEYSVKAENGAGIGRESPRIPVRVGAPAAPTISVRRDERSTRVTVTLPAGLPGPVEGVRIYGRRFGDSAYALLAQLDANDTTFDHVIGTRRLAHEYAAAVVIAGNESFWSQPRLAWRSADPAATPRQFDYVVAGPGVDLSWTAPSGPVTIAGYRVFRKPLDGSWAELAGTAGGPAVNATAVTDPNPGGETWFYYVVSENGLAATARVDASFCVQSMYQDLWQLHPEYERLVPAAERCELPPPPGPASPVRIRAANVTLGKYRLEYRFRPGTGDDLAGDPTVTIRIEPSPPWQIYLKANGPLVDARFAIHFDSDEVRVLPTEVVPFLTADDLLDVNSFSIDVRYERSFTLGVLMSDQRKFDPFSRTEEWSPIETLRRYADPTLVDSALSAKPVGPARFAVSSVKVDVSLHMLALTLGTFVAFLLLLGVAAIVNLANITIFAGLATGTVVLDLGPFGIHPLPIPWPIPVLDPAFLLATLLAALTLTLVLGNWIVGRILEAKISEEVEKQLKPRLDGSSFLWYAGEGVAEEIAYRAMASFQDGSEDRNGRNRFRTQTWQLVAVVGGVCKLIVRK
jgi:hypothetical protein